ncbi:hypothetical protein AB4Z45_32820 [Paenibacillus sp. MCAF9]|uniref:hypothetical protein n=1 Tax=unclassified Paenibacillus TaxID=185978 RepID=UPI003F9A275D
MNERSKVQNPLTIIAIFAGIAELAGTGVLIGLPIELQKTFMWFVMLFPVILVLSFFLVLIFKNNVLYAPSDFSNDQHYVDLQKDKIFSDLNDAKEIIVEAKDIKKSATYTSSSDDSKLIDAFEEKLNEIEKKIVSAQYNNVELSSQKFNKPLPYAYSKHKILEALETAGENGLNSIAICMICGITLEKFNRAVSILINDNQVKEVEDKFFIS